MEPSWTDIGSFWVGVAGVIIGTLVAVLLFLLQKRLNFRGQMMHREEVQAKVDEILGSRSHRKVELINIGRYRRDYPSNNDKRPEGYTYEACELKSYSYDGLSFALRPSSDTFSRGILRDLLIAGVDPSRDIPEAHYFGVIPYEWIEWIDIRGDDTSNRPHIFVRYRGWRLNGGMKTPFKTIGRRVGTVVVSLTRFLPY